MGAARRHSRRITGSLLAQLTTATDHLAVLGIPSIDVRGRMTAGLQAETMGRIDAFNAVLPAMADKGGAAFVALPPMADAAHDRRRSSRCRRLRGMGGRGPQGSGEAHAARVEAALRRSREKRTSCSGWKSCAFSRPSPFSSSIIGTSSTWPTSRSGWCWSACRSTASCMHFTIPGATVSGCSGASADLFSSGNTATQSLTARSTAGNFSRFVSRGFIRCTL